MFDLRFATLAGSAGLLAPLATLALLAAPNHARACGGTFCDNLPEPMPVDQRGEDILFVSNGAQIEVHIRIQYSGEAERFAWVVPLQAIPEVAVGSDPLFTALSNATAPSWTHYEDFDCDEDTPNWEDDGGIKLDLAGGDTDTGGDGGPDIVFEETVGAFEVVVLQGGTAAEVVDFLIDNNYAQDPSAEPILQEYVDEGFLFAAVKLSAGADVSEIHPLTFTFPGIEPCVPIRLTRIAAEEDMGIRTYFLAQDRWAPSNYAHVVLNPLAYIWSSAGADTYRSLLSFALDEAGGQAFTTEYSGTTSTVAQGNIFRPEWDESAFVGVDPITAIELIDLQGLATHPLIRSLLLEYIPPPPNVDAQDFWNNIEEYVDLIDPMAWDADAFAAALDERIIAPGLHGVELLDTWPVLTRLHALMSPGEMTLDPVFHATPDLPELTNMVATREQIACGGIERVYHVDLDGEDYPVCVPEGVSYPSEWDPGMPAALRIEQVPMMGPPQVTTDNLELITAAFASYDEGVSCEAAGGETGDTGAESGGNTDSGGEDGDESTETGPSYDLPYDISCGCSTPGGTAPVGLGFGLLVLALIGPWRRPEHE